MYQHQHAPLPLGRLKDVSQPVVVLLEKDPAQRFQTPDELLNAMPTITGAIDARRRITRQRLLKTPPTASRVGTRRPPARLGPAEISVARLPVTGSEMFGREEEPIGSGASSKAITELASIRSAVYRIAVNPLRRLNFWSSRRKVPSGNRFRPWCRLVPFGN